MKESIVLLALGACWAGYLAFYWRENRRTSHQRSNGIRAFSSGLGSLGGTASRPVAAFAPSMSALTPRTVDDAARRRREVGMTLGILAIITLFAAMSIGGLAIAIHVVVDLALAAYGFALVERRNDEAEREIKVHMLYPERVEAEVPAARRAVNS